MRTVLSLLALAALVSLGCPESTPGDGDSDSDGDVDSDSDGDGDVCIPDCAGRECGSDSCGGRCSPGCAPPDECDEGTGDCYCIPDCEGRECGSDGCRGSCGSCPTGETCDGTGTCECSYRSCDDVCCVEDEVCNEGSCCLSACEDRECGSDGCGGVCGPGCEPPDECDEDVGVCFCIPDCEDRECGSDGCGESCGPGCGGGEFCTGEGECVAATIGTWVTIRAGTFVMGSPRDEVGHDADETQHRVVLTRDFEIQTTEVTQAQFEEVMGRNPSYFSGCGGGCPVERVSWWDAVAYVNALSLLAGLPECYELIGCRGTPGGGCDGEPDCYGDYQCDEVRFASRHCWSYRLPTEAEWEYMARAGTTTATYNGDLDLDWIETWSCLFSGVLDPIAWFCANSEVEYDRAWDCSSWSGIRRCGPNEFATRTPNAWGLHDMLGNVWELCHDWYVEDLGGDPVGNPVGPESGEFRVLRGGSWIDNSWLTRAANRNGRGPSIRFNDTGFRPSRSLP